MQYADFENKLISELLKDKKKCIDTINDNKKVVEEYLKNAEKPFHVVEIVKKFNDIIIENLKKFKYIEKVLRHELFTRVFEEFRKSDVLIRAVKKNKMDAVKWLMTMDMDYFAQDENGVTALIEAAKNPLYLFVMKEVLKKNEDVVHITDNNDNTALFYVTDEKVFKLFLETKIDFNHINKDGDTLLIKCCKRKDTPLFDNILDRTSKENINHANNKGKTALMYLVERGYYNELDILRSHGGNLNYKNKNDESAVTILINKMKEVYSTEHLCFLENYVKTMSFLAFHGADFNVIIDEEGNTPIMYFIMIEEYFATTLLLERCENLDLSIKNKNGISVSYLLFSIPVDECNLRKLIISHKTFDYDFADNDNNNLIMHFLVRGKVGDEFKYLLQKKRKYNHVNNKKENELIIATKLGLLCEELLKDNDINQQDYLGNTALYYAIKLKDREAINMLVYHGADKNIKNNQEQSALDLAYQLKEEYIFEILKNPITPKEMKDQLEKEGKILEIFDKEKTTDNKLVDYIKNYQIKNYKEDYEYFFKNKNPTYSKMITIDNNGLLCQLRVYSRLIVSEAPNAILVKFDI